MSCDPKSKGRRKEQYKNRYKTWNKKGAHPSGAVWSLDNPNKTAKRSHSSAVRRNIRTQAKETLNGKEYFKRRNTRAVKKLDW